MTESSASRPKRATQATSAYERLRADVITAVLPPGQKLHIGDLCRRYDIGLSPLREALNRISQEGLVEQSDLRGFYAAPVSAEGLEDLTRARCWLAEILLREAINRGDAAWEETVVIAFHRLSRVPRYPDGEGTGPVFDPAWEAAHRAFHRSLVSACGSSWLIQLDQQMFDAADRYRHIARRAALGGTPARPDQHRAIMDAVLSRDTEQAIALLQAHYRRTGDLGQSILGGAK